MQSISDFCWNRYTCLDSCNNDVHMGMMLMIHHIVYAVCAVDCSSESALNNSYPSVTI